MALTKEDEDFICRHPLHINYDTLDAFTESSTATPSASPEREDQLSRRDAISNLLVGFQVSPVARRLQCSQRPIKAHLAIINARLQSDTYDLSPFDPLTKLLAGKASDLEIWQEILRLMTTLSRATPPWSSIPPSFLGTPLRRTSLSFRDSNQKREELRQHILMELSLRTYIDVPEFIVMYFENKAWSGRVDEILEELPAGAPLQDFPDASRPEEAEIWKWLNAFQEKHLRDAPNKFHRAESKSNIAGTTGERQLDILLKSQAAPPGEVHHLADCMVVGELTTSNTNVWKSKFAQLATYVRDVFAAQPIRRFVHGFLLFGVQMEMWVFDRSGAYGSVRFNVREQPQQFIRVLAGYAWMSVEELGLDTFVQRGGPFSSVTLSDPVTGEERAFQIEDKPFFHQPAIACRGTTCYRTLDKKHVVKFSWRPDKPQSEAEHLTRARGVKGVPRLVGASVITTIDELRSGLKIRKLRNLGYTTHERSVDPWQSSSTSQSGQRLESPGVSGIKRKVAQQSGSTPKRTRSNSLQSNLGQEVNQTLNMPPPDLPRRNRILTCLAITPAGRPLQDSTSVCEVLRAFRDAIKAHQELFTSRYILHRDISHGNIILTDPDQAEGYSGMLIDYDLAVQVGADGKNESSAEKSMTGTLDFMAIEVLESAARKETAGIERTYRHDLESFFYVLLALCVRYGWGVHTRFRPDALRQWYDGGYQDIAQAKRGAMGAKGFEIHMLSKFSPVFSCIKELARKLRGILFGTGDLYTDTPTDSNALYQPMITAFEEAIQAFEGVRQT